MEYIFSLKTNDLNEVKNNLTGFYGAFTPYFKQGFSQPA